MDYYKNQSYYDILGVEENASIESIEKAKNRLKFGESESRVPFSMWGKIDEAYSVLSDPNKRREYDNKLKEIDSQIKDFNDAYSDPNSTNSENQEEVIKKEEKQKDESLRDQQTIKKEDKVEYTIDYNPIESKNSSVKNVFKKIGGLLKTPAIYAGGTVIGLSIYGLGGAVVGFISAKLINKFIGKKIKLVRDNKEKKISEISTKESKARSEYLTNLEKDINNLLSKPHNNYKLEINKIKYENQIELMKKLLNIRLNKKLKTGEFIFHKLKVMDIKTQLNTATKNLEKINEKIAKYGKKQVLYKINKELIKVNQKLSEDKDEMKPLAVQKLSVYQNKLLKKRDKTATKIKTRVLRSGAFYDKLVRTKDFVVSRKYLFTPSEEIDRMLEEGKNR